MHGSPDIAKVIVGSCFHHICVEQAYALHDAWRDIGNQAVSLLCAQSHQEQQQGIAPWTDHPGWLGVSSPFAYASRHPVTKH